jgi:alpha-tubulin suppressor-like RCC1 family protein
VGHRTVPVPVAGQAAWLAIDAGESHACGVRTDHSLWCWGDNDSGRFTDVLRVRRPVPIPAARR